MANQEQTIIEHCNEENCPECQRELLNTVLNKILNDIKKAKEFTNEQTGSFKYDETYDECIEIVERYRVGDGLSTNE